MKQIKIRHVLTILVIAISTSLVFSSCSKDEDGQDFISGFNYPAESIYGTWQLTKVDGKRWPYQATTATFNSDGTYSGRGYFGNGTGTYTAKGNTIKCYVGGTLYMQYDIVTLEGKTATMRMSAPNSSTSLTVTCEKQ